MAKVAKTPQMLASASDHLHYEIMMLRFTALELSGRQAEESQGKNALLESFAIHVRNLRSFFCKKSTNLQNEMLAIDYLKDWTPPRSEYLDKLEGKINEQISHLSYKRLTISEEAKSWEIDLIVEEIRKLLVAFLEKVPETHLGGKMHQLKASRLESRSLGFAQSVTGSTSSHTSSTSALF